MKRRNSPTLVAFAQGVLAVVLTLSLAQAADAATSKSRSRSRSSKKKSAAVHAPAKAQGVRAYIDPATGRLTSPKATDAPGAVPPVTQAGARTVESDAPVAEILHADGTVEAKLDERFQEFEVARIGPDGKLVRSCVQGPARAEKARKAEPQPAPAKELQ